MMIKKFHPILNNSIVCIIKQNKYIANISQF